MSLSTAPNPEVSLELPEVPRRRSVGVRERAQAHALAADVARIHGEALIRTARRYSASPDDAHDAYQRAMELLLEHASTIDRAKAVAWMQVVVRREALALTKQHGRTVPLDGAALDHEHHRVAPAPDEHLHAIDLAQRAGEALATLKESEAQALCLRAQGMSYEEIADLYGWSYTKVNRAVTEGRKAFVDHYQAVESGVVCSDTAELMARYVAGELKPRVAIKVRAHLVRCSGCRSLLHAERGADTALRALLPPVFIAAAGTRKGTLGWLHDHLLGPIGHVAGRLQPIADHLTGAKLGVVAASALALAGGGVAAEHHARHAPKVAPIRAGLVRETASGATAAPDTGLRRVVDTAVTRGTELRSQARQRAARTQAAASARRKAAAKAQRAASAREFTPKSAEFASTTKHSVARAKKAAASGGGSASAPTTEVSVGGDSGDSTVSVTPERSPSPGGSSDSVSNEFGN